MTAVGITGVGIIGVGALGQAIADAITADAIPDVELAAIAGRPRSASSLAGLARRWRCRATTDPLELPALGAGLVVESAGVEAAAAYTAPLLATGVDVLLMSTGALADPAFAREVKAAARAAGQRVYLPSGAIAGLDGLQAAIEGGVHEVRITTRKHPDALRGAPFLSGALIGVENLDQPTVVFEGSVPDAIAGFPSNINVAVTVATVVDDVDKVSVRIIADPGATTTMHKVEVRARPGSMTVEVKNLPLPANPRTSWLAALSAIATIRRIASPLRIG